MPRRLTRVLLLTTCLTLPYHSLDAEPQPSEETWESSALARIDSLHGTSNPALVHAVLDSLFELAEARSDSAFRLDLLLRRGHEWVSYGEGQRGEPILREACDLARTLGDSADLLTGLRWLGLALGSQGRFREAGKVLQQTVDLALEIGHRSKRAWGLIGLGWCAERMGRFEEAKQTYRTAAELFEEIGETRGQIWALNGLSTCYEDLGRHDSTAASYQEVADKAHEIGDQTLEAMATNNLGTLAYALGDPGLAMAHFRDAEALYELSYDHRGTLVAEHNIVDCLNLLGRSDEAEARLRDLLKRCRQRGYDDLEAAMLNALGDLRIHQNRYDDARLLFRQVVSKGYSLPVLYQMDGLLGLSNALAETDSSNAAEQLLRKVLTDPNETFSGGHRVRLMGNHAKRLLEIGRPDEALTRLRHAAREAASLELPLARVELMTLSGEAYGQLGQHDSSLVLLEQAAETWETVRDIPLDPEWREQRSELGRRLYPQLAEVILTNLSGQTKDERCRAAFDRLQAFKSRTLLERMLGPGEPLDASADSLSPGLTTLEEVQTAVLRPDELLIDTYVGPESTFLFAITRNECRVAHLPPEQELFTRITRYRDLLKQPGGAGAHTVSAEVRTTVQARLFDALFSDIEDLLLASRRVFIAPDGPLNLVPYTELTDGHGGDGTWARIPSGTVLAKLRRSAKAPRPTAETHIQAIACGFTGSGQSIPGAIDEVRSLARIYDHVETTLLKRTDSDFNNALLQNGEILHLAAHVKINDQSPWQTEIELLYGDHAENPRAGQIATMQLPARLVVLSGCESGSGRILAGEGVLGLTSAFLSAGVPTVVASLWPVDDRATVSFMQDFYDGLADDLSAGSALKLARDRMRANPRTSHPFYWAGFFLVGEPDSHFSVARQGGSNPVPYLLLGLAIAVGGWMLILRTRQR